MLQPFEFTHVTPHHPLEFTSPAITHHDWDHPHVTHAPQVEAATRPTVQHKGHGFRPGSRSPTWMTLELWMMLEDMMDSSPRLNLHARRAKGSRKRVNGGVRMHSVGNLT